MTGLGVLVAVLLATAAAAETIVVLPFENFSAAADGASAIEQRMIAALQARHWTVVAGADVEALLAKRRIRYLDALDDDSRKAILEATGATTYVAGSVYEYDGGTNPLASFAARMVRLDGTVAWADVAGVAAADTQRTFGFGRATTAEEVAAVAMSRLVKHLPLPGDDPRPLYGPQKPLFRGGPVTFRDASIDPKTPHLVCILPLENRADGAAEAARVVGEVLAIRMAAASGFEVVDPAKMRAAALKAHVASFHRASNGLLAALAPLVGTPLFLRGTIYDYQEVNGRALADPAVELELTLVDAVAGRVVWSSQHERKGSEYEGLLLLGAASNAVFLTDRVVTEMIDAQTSVAAPRRAGAAAQKRAPSRHSELRRKDN